MLYSIISYSQSRWVQLIILYNIVLVSLSGASVTGQVVDHSTGQPIAKAIVTLIPFQERQDPSTLRRASLHTEHLQRVTSVLLRASSSADGRYSFAEVKAGRYTLVANRRGYLNSPFRAWLPTQSSAIIELGPTTEVIADIRMFRPSIVAGRVLDGDGIPLDSGFVQALVETGESFGDAFRIASSGVVNDLGEFRISGLLPGSYRLRFEPVVQPAEQTSLGEYILGYGTSVRSTYYPSEDSISGATEIVLQTGGEATGRDLIVRESRKFQVSGRIDFGEKAIEYGSVRLWPDGEKATAILLSNSILGTNGHFEIKDVAPGDYALLFAVGSGGAMVVGRHSVSVVDRDLSGLIVNAPAPISMSGQILSNGDTPRDLSGASVVLVPAGSQLSPTCPASIDTDGAIRFENCSPGLYRVDVVPPSGFVCTQVTFGGNVIDNGTIQLSSTAQLTVSLARGGGEIRGTVDLRSLPQESRSVQVVPYFILFPVSEAGEPMSGILRGVVAANGNFSVGSLPPGKYVVVASEVFDDLLLSDKRFRLALAQHVGFADVVANEVTTVVVKALSAELLAGFASSAK